jgi:NitT/TauT family transport system permease protein
VEDVVVKPVVVNPARQTIRNRVAFLEKVPPFYAPVMGIFVLLVLWEALAQVGVFKPDYLPAPTLILSSGWEMLLSGEIYNNLLASLGRIGAGFAIGASAGIIVGLFLGFFRWLDALFTPVVYSLYPIPKIALLPLLILWLGIGETPKLVIIALGVFYPVVLNTHAGVKNVDRSLIKAAVTFGAKPFNIIRKVILPASLPTIFAGLKMAAGYSMLLMITAEMIAAEKGIGAMIMHYGNMLMTSHLMVGVVILSVLGLLINRSLEWVERKSLPWR